jgi:hypothetical protein
MAKFNTGQSFADGDTVTGAKLNNITSQLNIYTGVISEQAAMSATVSTVDQLLIADADNGDSGAANKITVQKLFDDSLTNGTYTAANLSGTITANRTVATSATITTGTIPNLTSSTANITLGTIPTLTAGTTTSTAATITSGTITNLASTTGTIATLNSTTGTIATLNSTTSTITNLSTTLAGDFTISQGTATLATSGATAGTYGSVTAIPFITVDAKGRITSATTGTFSSTPADGSITPAKLSQPLTLATAVASTSGTAIDFTGIPSWAKRITVMFQGVSTNGASSVLIRLGTSSGFVASGYIGSSATFNFSNGMLVDDIGNSAGIRHGIAQILNITGNSWVCGSSLGRSDAIGSFVAAGSISLASLLTQIRITTGGGDTFDAGNINIIYEG